MWIIYHWIIAVGLIFLILQIYAVESAILDSRCYLEGGGSAESFLASEDLEIGTIIGKLRINGDPDMENGDINLALREKDAPVEIVPGTKDLALAVELDKEGRNGPSSIYVNVICIRRHSTDPSFVIPVNVRVIDVNDNAPQWIGTPYTLTLSEVTVPGTRILQGAKAEDADQQGPFSTVEYQVLPGPYSEYVQFLNPLEGTLVLKKPLDYEQMQNFTVKLRAQDQGTPPKFSDTILRVVITDADDQNPKFLRETYNAELPTDGRPGELKIRPEPIKAIDQDEGICAPIQYSIVQSQDTKYFRIHPHSGVITLLTPIGYSDLTNGATLVVKATQIDNLDRYALTTVTLARPGGTHSDMSALAFVQKKFHMRIREDTAVGNRILALPTNKPGKHLKYTIPDPVNSQFFNVGSLGEVILTKALDFEKMTRHDFQVFATDGMTNTTAEISLEVIDVNDWEPRFRETHYEFIVPKSQSLQSRIESLEGVMIGKIEAADGDRNDKLELSLRGQHAGLFEIDSTGNIYMRPEQLQTLNESTIHLIAIATDSGVPPRSTSVPVTVTMEGVAMAQASWSNNLLGMFGIIMGVFVVIILCLTCYIVRYKSKTRKTTPTLGRNRVHSHGHSTVSSANLVTHEKVAGNGNGATVTSGNVSVLHMKHNGNITMANPIGNGGFQPSTMGSNMGLGASAILAASLERERERERQRENYAATVRSIVSRASANGQLYEEDEIENDSLCQPLPQSADNNNKKMAWETPSTAASHQTGVTTISCANGGVTSVGVNGSSNLLTATDTMGSSENNLTVYF
ncbi:protocadherin Fat 1 [Lucilia cuprina]|uniref:protocadherin Fat 1 n=1 Tax=Lucilia cuprina TaxID=7375 RepID=UPI001F05AC3F|nr:protocadherin Fat 1 [Lucilia cuprina]XP_046805579.1 protocadherin Fat 1 [Lucilia cuprina]XP_046805580.1 protocadherin Fat 1 [Lucilia cuprina]